LQAKKLKKMFVTGKVECGAIIEHFRRMEHEAIPEHFDYTAVRQLRAEAREKLTKIRPASLGQASRISGITPADLTVLMLYFR
jgi:tRNA uridine 5-carboxymethylaminomethyl modification enzyme